MTAISPAAQVRLRAACFPVVSAADDPADLRWTARDYRDVADLGEDLTHDARSMLRDVGDRLRPRRGNA